MSLLLWLAVLIGLWCAASVVVALALGTFLRARSRYAADLADAVRPLDTGPLRLWLAEQSVGGVTVPGPRPAASRDGVASR